MDKKEKNFSAWFWIPTLYIAKAISFIIITSVSVIMYQSLEVSNSEIIFYTSLLYLPWLIKPFWSPLIDAIGTKRDWILFTQVLLAISFIVIAFLIQLPDYFQFTIIALWIVSFIAATHDIAVDGFYLVALKESDQSFFIGIRNSFYKIALISTATLVLLFSNQIEKIFSVSPAEFKVVANPNKFFEETIKVDSLTIKQKPGPLKLVSSTSYLEISTKPKTKDQVVFYANFARNMNMMNGFVPQSIVLPDTSMLNDLVGNIGIIKFHLSKKPSEKDEYVISLKFVDGDNKFKVIEGNTLKFTSLNWNKPAFAVIQIDSNVTNKTIATFSAGVEKFSFGWTITFGFLSLIFLLLFVFHKFILPYPSNDEALIEKKNTTVGKEFFRSFARYFEKKKIILIILFFILYLFGHSQITKVLPQFLTDDKIIGGLYLQNYIVKIIKGISTITFALGSLIAGFIIYKKGLKSLMMIFTLMMNISLAVYIYLSWFLPNNFWIVTSLIGFENLCYGFGFSLILMYILNVSEGNYPSSHFAISFGFMSLGILLSEFSSLIIKDSFGYKYFFIWVLISTIPSFILVKLIPIEYNFGKKKISESQL
ncbi:MAG: MFS transporter [Stygiobacter sp.]